jgi:CPA1 family monovalent cation:H+ antiporter
VLVSIGIGARPLVNTVPSVPFTIVLVIVGLLIAVLPLQLALELSHDSIFLVFLPPILFAGGLSLDFERVRQNAPLISLLLVVGLPVAIIAMGFGGQYVFGFPLAVALLLGSMLYPLYPVAVLSVFTAMDAPDRLLSNSWESRSLVRRHLCLERIGFVIFTEIGQCTVHQFLENEFLIVLGLAVVTRFHLGRDGCDLLAMFAIHIRDHRG